MTTAPQNMTAVCLREDGFSKKAVPSDQVKNFGKFLEVTKIDVPVPSPGQVLIKVIASMVNPSDMAFIQGGYGQPRIKGVPAGFEGVGTVIGGKGLMAMRLKDKRVSFVVGPNGSGAWAEYATADAATVIPLKNSVSSDDGAALIVNPLTAAAMVELVEPGGAFIASGAASQLGKLMASDSADSGKRMIALTRRDEPIETLTALGAHCVLNETSEGFGKSLASVISSEKPRVFLDCVSGAVSARVFDAMGNDSRWVIYGKLTSEPPEILEPGKLIFQRKVIEGFWLVTWLQRTGIFKKLTAIRRVQNRFSS